MCTQLKPVPGVETTSDFLYKGDEIGNVFHAMEDRRLLLSFVIRLVTGATVDILISTCGEDSY